MSPAPTGHVAHTSTTTRLDITDGPTLVGASGYAGVPSRVLVDRLDVTVTESTRDGERTRRVYATAYGYVLRKDGTPGERYTHRSIHNPDQSDTITALADVLAAAGLDMTEVHP